MKIDYAMNGTGRQRKRPGQPDRANQALIVPPRQLRRVGLQGMPALIVDAGEAAARRTIEFFTAYIRNRNTRFAYSRAVACFSAWCTERGLALEDIAPVHVAGYIEELNQHRSKPTVKQHLAAGRMLFDYLVIGQVMPLNPAHSVRGPRHAVRTGKTLVLEGRQAHELLESIDIRKIAGLRDRALIALLIYSFARVSAAIGMNVEDYYQGAGRTMFVRLHEKNGKDHDVPAHFRAVEFLDAYLGAGGIAPDKRGPLFRSLDRHGRLTDRRIERGEVWKMIRRRARNAALPVRTCCHTMRATGITVYLQNGGTLEHAQTLAAHSSPRTTKLYDRTDDRVTLDEINRIDLTRSDRDAGYRTLSDVFQRTRPTRSVKATRTRIGQCSNPNRRYSAGRSPREKTIASEKKNLGCDLLCRLRFRHRWVAHLLPAVVVHNT